MDARRLLIPAAAGLSLAACSTLPHLGLRPLAPGSVDAATTAEARPEPAPSLPATPTSLHVEARAFATMAPIPNPQRRAPTRTATRARAIPPPEPDGSGRAAIAAANASALATSRSRAFLGGVQVFVYDPGRVYEVWTAPLRVTTLTLSPGETIISKAAGDTVRWQIGETQSGDGPGQRAHVMIKPLQRGLATNLVLATSHRVYLLELRSGAPETLNTAITWDVGAVLDTGAPTASSPPPGLVAPQGPLDARFRIAAKGRRPAWTPTAVMTDGVRTFLTFPATVTAAEAPALFAVGPDGQAQLVNYRQQGGLWVVDRVLQAAELRVGGRRAQVVRIERMGAPS
ncbi:MAG: conjugal transfer protein TrbG [Phenylobacterium sp.]|uniref:TrbG/VirB9 family P-type conjugative transfer protein n=1 Tax=Phenylobacterium sp. TaxID=1871053 RepID=UPI00120F4EBA|nr:TrbG/VirB9 family P-type conjugative transfer protein [Phenylobacterium sp.]TAJ68777.1 MAG: conjugal transfer protein TrbG [Phenylobacterium sp.]